jgi:heme-degrading monooxygenase HmoA
MPPNTDAAVELARTPSAPYTAVIFTSLPGEKMELLAAEQPGYLGIESARGDLGITVSYWATAEHARAWKAVAEHRTAQQLGRERWYRTFRVRIATVEREYGF